MDEGYFGENREWPIGAAIKGKGISVVTFQLDHTCKQHNAQLYISWHYSDYRSIIGKRGGIGLGGEDVAQWLHIDVVSNCSEW